MKRLSIVILLLWPLSASLHPHSWINLTTDFVIDDNEQLIQVRQRWIFDEFYSAMMLADLDREFPDRTLALSEHSRGMLKSLGEHGYFSHLVIGGERIALQKPVKHRLQTVSLDGADMLMLEMHFDLDGYAADQTISWKVYDPTYYVSMRHDDVSLVRLINDSALECMPSLIEPNPTEEQRAYASSLDQNQTETDGLGKLFAQEVQVQCF